MTNSPYTLESATNDDIEFIYRLRIQTMKPFFEPTIGWNDKEQYQSAAENIEETKIIIHNSNKIGAVKILERPDFMVLHQIQIMPEYQNQGIGNSILQMAIKRSNQLGLPIKLMVMRNTPAQTMYENHGFKEIESYEYNLEMCRQPA